MPIIEIYECDRCRVRSYEGPDDGLPDGWQANVDDCVYCPECLAKYPLDAHECDNDMCCYGATTPRSRAGGLED